MVQRSYLFDTGRCSSSPLPSFKCPNRGRVRGFERGRYRGHRPWSQKVRATSLKPKEPYNMKERTGAKIPNSKPAKHRNSVERAINPTRREFLRTAAGAGLALAGSPIAAWADHHGHPSPNSISYLDRRMYIRNMEILAHFMPGHVRNGKMQMMSIGNRRYIFQQGDVIDVSDVRKPTFYNRGGFEGGQVQVAYNKNLKKWILMTGAQTPITD